MPRPTPTPVPLLLLLTTLTTLTTCISLPPLTGPHPVGTLDLQLTDTSRANPFAATPPHRTIMISLFYPRQKQPHSGASAGGGVQAYMPNHTATKWENLYNIPPHTLNQLTPHAHVNAPIARSAKAGLPLLLFSPGFSMSRQLYTTYFEELASHGYLVVSMDHTYDATIVQFPDGSVVVEDPRNNLSDATSRGMLFEARVQDTLFLLDELYTGGLTTRIPGVGRGKGWGKGGLRFTKTGMFGHSFGGCTTAEVMTLDKRVSAGLNLDGAVYTTTENRGPMAIMGTPVHNLHFGDVTWPDYWETLKGWKRFVVIEESRHLTYSDFPVLVDLLGLQNFFGEGVLEDYLGTIEPRRAAVVMSVWIGAFFDRWVKGGRGGVWEGKNAKEWPEVYFQT